MDTQTPTFRWHPGPGEIPDHYIWSVLFASTSDPRYVDDQYDFNVRDTFKTSDFLPPDELLRWKVEAVDRNGCRSGDLNGIGRFFRIDVGVTCRDFENQSPDSIGPGSFDPNKPEEVTRDQLIIRWHFFNGATRYTVPVQRYPDPPQPVRYFIRNSYPDGYPKEDELDYLLDSSALPLNQGLYWKIKGEWSIFASPGVCTSSYSSIRYFIIRPDGSAPASGDTHNLRRQPLQPNSVRSVNVDAEHATARENVALGVFSQTRHEVQQPSLAPNTAVQTDSVAAPRLNGDSLRRLHGVAVPLPSEELARSTVASLRPVEPWVPRCSAFSHNDSVWDDLDHWLVV